jgi:hypothetical protein
MSAADQPLHHECAHLAEPNHSEFHLLPPNYFTATAITPLAANSCRNCAASLKLNRTHPQLQRALKIQFPVVNEQAFFRLALRHFKRQPVDSLIGFPDAKIARAEEGLKLPPQLKLPDPVFVQFEPLVVDGGKQIFSSCSHLG